jgi:hypothetical protein
MREIMSDEIMNLDRRWKTWEGFLRFMTYTGVATTIILALMWWTLV